MPGRRTAASPASPAIPDAAAIARWLRREIAHPPLRARSLIVTVWGDALAPHGGEVWLSTLMRLVAPFGVNERLVRTSVYRLAQEGWLAAESVGRRSRYRLTAEGVQRFAQAYRRVYTPPFRRWDGRWDIVVAPADAVPAAQRQAFRDELAWNGFAAIAPGTYVRPGGEAIDLVTLARGSERIVRFVARDLAATGLHTLASRVDDAFALEALATEYRRFVARFAGVIAAFRSSPPPPPEQAFAVRTLLVHEYRRVRLRDPQLPPSLLPARWPGAAAYALCRDFYRAAVPLAETHLADTLAADGERLPPVGREFHSRFAVAE